MLSYVHVISLYNVLTLANSFFYHFSGWRVFLNKTYSLSIFFGSLYYIYNAMVYFGMAMDFQTHAGNKYLNR